MNKQIKLNNSSPFFRPEQFETKIFDGTEVPVMKLSKEDSYNESLFFALYSADLQAMPHQKSDARKFFCVTDRFYIIVERGETGFDTSFHYFAGAITEQDNGFTIDITPIDDKEITDAVYDKYLENEYSCIDVLNEHVMHGNDRSSDCSLAAIQMVEKTAFICLPFNGNQSKIPAKIDSDGELSIRYAEGYKVLETDKEVYGKVEIGTLLYRRSTDIRNHVTITKLTKYAHDFAGEFWGVIETVFTYPQDADSIRSSYPDFYRTHCVSDSALKKQTLLKNSHDLPYIREDYVIGDGIIHIPIDTSTKEISIPCGDFHFIMENNKFYSHLSRKNKEHLRLNDMPMLCSLIEIDRRYKLVFYNTSRFVKCGDKYYAELKFREQSKYFDSFDANEIISKCGYGACSIYRNAITCAVYLMFRNVIKPLTIDKDLLGSNITEE